MGVHTDRGLFDYRLRIMKTYTSTHAEKRAKYKFGIEPEELSKLAKEVWENGDEIPPELIHVYINRTINTNRPNTKYVAYDDKLFIFGTQYFIPRLITLMSIKKP